MNEHVALGFLLGVLILSILSCACIARYWFKEIRFAALCVWSRLTRVAPVLLTRCPYTANGKTTTDEQIYLFPQHIVALRPLSDSTTRVFLTPPFEGETLYFDVQSSMTSIAARF